MLSIWPHSIKLHCQEFHAVITAVINMRQKRHCPHDPMMPRSITFSSAHFPRAQMILTHWSRDKMAAIFQTTFSNGFSWMKMLNLDLNFTEVRCDGIDNIPALIQIMAWRLPGDKPLSESEMVSLLTHICVTRPQWVKPGGWKDAPVNTRCLYFVCFSSLAPGWCDWYLNFVLFEHKSRI